MAVHQVVVGASPGDAVTGAALRFRETLRRLGPSDVYARYIHPALAGDVRGLGEYGKASPAWAGDVIVYHASIGNPDVAAFLRSRRERLVLMYHNITPPEYFASFDPAFAGLLAEGRLEVAGLRHRVDVALAVSGYNAAELEALGYRDVGVSPLPLDLDCLRAVEPDPATVERLAAEVDGRPVALFVGQLLPHKRPDLLLLAFHVLRTYLLPEAHLVLVGAGRLPSYLRALEAVIDDLGLDARITGWVTEPELVAYYRAATCFVTLSEHEGVCVPLLEAMALDLPVVARGYAAIPETMAGAGVLLPQGDDPLLVAEAMARLATDDTLRLELVSRGRRRIDDVAAEPATGTFLRHLAEVL